MPRFGEGPHRGGIIANLVADTLRKIHVSRQLSEGRPDGGVGAEYPAIDGIFGKCFSRDVADLSPVSRACSRHLRWQVQFEHQFTSPATLSSHYLRDLARPRPSLNCN